MSQPPACTPDSATGGGATRDGQSRHVGSPSRPWANVAPIRSRPVRLAPDAGAASLAADDGLAAPAVERDAAARADASGGPAAEGAAEALRWISHQSGDGHDRDGPPARRRTRGRGGVGRPAPAAAPCPSGPRPRGHPSPPSSHRATGFPHQCDQNGKLGRACNTLRGPRAPMSAPCGYPGSAPGPTPGQRRRQATVRLNLLVRRHRCVQDVPRSDRSEP